MTSCSISTFANSDCGYSPYFKNETDNVRISECDKNVANHLASVNLKCTKDVPTEGHLICYRVGIFSKIPFYTVCPKHRYALGICWKKNMSCEHPNHKGKTKSERSVTLQMSQALLQLYGKLVPIGSGICRNCRGDLYKNMPDLEEINIDSIDNKENTENQDLEVAEGKTKDQDRYNTRKLQICFSQKLSECEEQNSDCIQESQESCESQLSNWSDNAFSQVGALNESMNQLSRGEVSPLKYQLNSSLSEIGPTASSYIKRKAKETVMTVLNVIAPGQGEELLSLISTESPVNKIESATDNKQIFETIKHLYNETDNNIVKEQLLSIVSETSTKDFLQNEIGNLSKYKIDKVRRSDFLDIGKTSSEPARKRARMDEKKLEHALDFFFNPAFHQVVSYGTRELQVESGETIRIPDVVRTLCHSTLVTMYLSHCEESNFSSLSRATLYNILNACAASKRTNLHGLDNITADGYAGFEAIFELLSSLEKSCVITSEEKQEISSSLKSCKEYLKGQFKLNLSKSSECQDHCITWALSEPGDKHFKSKCDHTHSTTCKHCADLHLVLDKLMCINFSSEDDKEECLESVKKIYSWKAHIVRTVNQDKSRLDKLQSLEEHQVLIVMDWAMKFLPKLHRETQSDWFGQKGISWHVSVCIFKDHDNLNHMSYVHLVKDGCKQDWYAVACFLEHVLQTLKKDRPEITEAYLRSDNAGCYHNGTLWLTLKDISQQTGVAVKSYCFSEAQSGKSYCDAKIAHLRQKMTRFVMDGNNITTAQDMKLAIDSGNGVAGCQASVVSINTTNQLPLTNKWKHVNSINNIIFEDEVTRQFKAYEIGDGEIVKIANNLSFETGLELVDDFKKPKNVSGNIKVPGNVQEVANSVEVNTVIQNEDSVEDSTVDGHSHSNQKNIFVCPEVGCTKSYKLYSAFQKHVFFGKHVYELSSRSTFDEIRHKWADSCNTLSSTSRVTSSKPSFPTSESESSLKSDMGWALKQQRKNTRFDKSVKDYLEKIFNAGEISGKKANPNEVARTMKTLVDEEGKRLFSPQKCLQSNQIASYFSRLAVLNRRGQSQSDSKNATDISDEHVDQILDEIEQCEIVELFAQ